MAKDKLLFLSGGQVSPRGETYRVSLNGTEVVYTLKRCRRRTIGMKIDSYGLTVSIPPRESLRWVESALRDKADWVIRKLAEWTNKKLIRLVWEEAAIFPLLGEPWKLTKVASGSLKMTPLKITTETEDKQLTLPFPSTLTESQIEELVMTWYDQKALSCFSERLMLFANKLGVPLPKLRLSRAKTQWGSCNAHGVIRLNWRLIQIPLPLVDYVVAHELSHLVEMNHSPAFWRTVESIYPDYQAARKELQMLG